MKTFAQPGKIPDLASGEAPVTPPEDEDSGNAGPQVKKKSWLRRIALFCSLAFLFFLLLLIGAGIALKYYFPSERLTPIAERELTKILNMPVAIGSIDVNLLTGLKVSRLTLGGKDPLAGVHEVVLDYDLTQLLKGRLIINRVIVLDPAFNLVSTNGVWNFQPLLGKEKPGKPAPPAKPFAGLPPFPIAVDLKEFAIRNIRFNLDRDGETKSRLEGLSLEAKGKINREEIDVWLRTTLGLPPDGKSRHNLEFFSSQGKGIDVKTLATADLKVTTQDLNRIRLSGALGLKKSAVDIGGVLPSPDLSTDIDLDVALKEQLLNIKRLILKIGRENRIDLSGEAAQFGSDPAFTVRINEAAFVIEDFIAWAGKNIPPVEASGKLKITGLEVKGSLPGFKPGDMEVQSGRIEIQNLSGNYPEASAAMSGVDTKIEIVNATLKNGIPEAFEGNVFLNLEHAEVPNLTLNGLSHDLKIKAKGANLNEVTLTFATALKKAKVSPPGMDAVTLGLHLDGSLGARLDSGDVHFVNLNYSLGTAAKGSVKGSAANFGKTSFKVEQSVDLDFKALRSVVPANLLKKIDGFPGAGNVQLSTGAEGQLDPKFQPVKVQANTRIELKEIDTRLKQPAIEVKQFAATIAFPLDYLADKGVKISQLDVDTRFAGVKALGQYEIASGESKTRLTMGAYYPLQGSAGKIPVTDKTTITIGRVQSSAPDLLLTGLALDMALKSDVYPKDFKNLTLKGNVSVQDVEGVKEVKTGKIQTSFDLDVNDMTLTRTRASVNIKVDAPSGKNLQGLIPIGPIAVASVSRQNLKTGDIEIDRATVDAPSLLSLAIKGKLKNWGKTFDIDAKMPEARLAALWEKVPPALRADMKDLEVSGNAALSVNAKGRVPEKLELKKSSLPIVAKARFGLEEMSLNWPGRGIAIANMNTSTQIDFQEGSGAVAGKLSLEKLFLKEALGETALNPEFAFNYSLKDFNKFTVREHEFTIKNHGIRHSISGRVDGLQPFLTGKVPTTAEELVRRLDVSLVTDNQLQIQKALADGAQKYLKDIQATGALRSRLALTLAPEEKIALDGNVEFDQFNAEVPEKLKVTNLNGRFPFNKTLFLKRSLVPPATESFLASRKGFFSQLRDFSRHKNNFMIDAVQAGRHRISNIGLDLLFKNNQLLAEKFLFDVLEGSVAGNLFVVPTAQGPELSFSTEFAGLNLGGLVGKTKATEAADSEVDGNLQFGLKLKHGQEKEPVSIDQIDAQIAITRIGAETLDRILLFLDPEESKPAIVDTRAKLQLASPHRILVSLKNGNLNVEAWLKNKILGDIIKAPELKRLPISSLKQFRQINDQLQAMTGLRDALNYLAARGMEFNEDGEMTLY